MKTLTRSLSIGAAALLAGTALTVANPAAAPPANASNCRTEGVRMICQNYYPGGAQGDVQFIYVVNGYSFDAYFEVEGGYTCIASGESLVIDRSVPRAGAYRLNGNSLVPWTPAPC